MVQLRSIHFIELLNDLDSFAYILEINSPKPNKRAILPNIPHLFPNSAPFGERLLAANLAQRSTGLWNEFRPPKNVNGASLGYSFHVRSTISCARFKRSWWAMSSVRLPIWERCVLGGAHKQNVFALQKYVCRYRSKRLTMTQLISKRWYTGFVLFSCTGFFCKCIISDLSIFSCRHSFGILILCVPCILRSSLSCAPFRVVLDRGGLLSCTPL